MFYPFHDAARSTEPVHGKQELEVTLRLIATELGVLHVCCARFSSIKGFDANLVTAKVTYPFRWQARYFLKQYATIDPVITRSKTAVEPFDWEELATEGLAVQRFFEDAARHGVGQNGFSIPVRPDQETDFSVVSFNSNHTKPEWRQFKAENTEKMAQSAILIHSAAQNDLQRHSQPAFLLKRDSRR